MRILQKNYMSVRKEEEFYTQETDPRLKLSLTWSPIHSQDSSGESCFINLEKTTLSETDFFETFISKDKDWVETTNPQNEITQWSQCVKDGEDEFKFDASLNQGALKLAMLRSNILHKKVCGSKLTSSMG